jgi:hypothetical protein
MISRELLSEVLGCKLDINEQLQPNDIEYIEKVGSRLYCRTINIYELAFLTRDWFESIGLHLDLNLPIDLIWIEAEDKYKQWILENKEV